MFETIKGNQDSVMLSHLNGIIQYPQESLKMTLILLWVLESFDFDLVPPNKRELLIEIIVLKN